MPMSSTTISSARVILVMVLVVDPSTAARPIAAVNDSRVNHDTRIPASITACANASTKWVLPVPDGPLTARFSARCTHSNAARAPWVGAGIDESSSRHEENVLPAGSPAALRRIALVASSRPRISSVSRTLRTSVGSHRCAFAVASTSGAAARR